MNISIMAQSGMFVKPQNPSLTLFISRVTIKGKLTGAKMGYKGIYLNIRIDQDTKNKLDEMMASDLEFNRSRFFRSMIEAEYNRRQKSESEKETSGTDK